MKLRKEWLEGLNENQRRAVQSKSNRILCLAGAGSGKTTVLTKRIAYVLDSRVSPRNILCITFTRAAAKEMKTRIIKLNGEKGKRVFIDTFHKFCMSIINKYGRRIGFTENFSVLNQDIRLKVLEELSVEYNLKEKAKDASKVIEKYEEYELNSNYKAKQLVETYITYMKENNSIDIDMIQYFAWYLLKEYKDIKEYYNQTYKYISVDEYQDTNNIQNYILKEINPENLFVVGDNRQAIYGFRGSSVEHILNFDKEHKDTEVIQLCDNYRSTFEIVTASNKLIAHAKQQISQEMVSHKKGEDLIYIQGSDEENQIQCVVNKLTSYDEVEYKDMAIIARTNAELDNVARYLAKCKIPYSRQVKDTISQDLLRNISYLLDMKNSNKLMNLIKKVNRIPDSELADIKISSLKQGLTLYDYILTTDGSAKDVLMELQDVLSLNDSVLCIKRFLEMINTATSEISKVIDRITGWKEDKELLGEKDITLNTFVKDMYLDASKKNDNDGINLVTVHGSKGLEWHSIAILGLYEKNFPSRRGDEEEELRLCYVAITRARERLILASYKHGVDFKKAPKDLLESRYINYLK